MAQSFDIENRTEESIDNVHIALRRQHLTRSNIMVWFSSYSFFACNALIVVDI